MRADGRRIKTIDPMQKMIPHIMRRRYDAQVFFKIDYDYNRTRNYINEKRKEGVSISFMSIFFAAYLHAVARYPQVNRFIINKRIYARNEVWISFIILKDTQPDDEPDEAVIKLKLEFTDTLFDIERKISQAIEENRKADVENGSDKAINAFMDIPLLSGPVISFAMWLDKVGLLPKSLIDFSPFHSSIILTNMSSLKLDTVYHHIYDFGTTSTFASMGKLEIKKDADQNKKYTIPMGLVIDERICAGVTYAKAIQHVKRSISDPVVLEKAPDIVKDDIE